MVPGLKFSGVTLWVNRRNGKEHYGMGISGSGAQHIGVDEVQFEEEDSTRTLQEHNPIAKLITDMFEAQDKEKAFKSLESRPVPEDFQAEAEKLLDKLAQDKLLTEPQKKAFQQVIQTKYTHSIFLPVANEGDGSSYNYWC